MTDSRLDALERFAAHYETCKGCSGNITLALCLTGAQMWESYLFHSGQKGRS